MDSISKDLENIAKLSKILKWKKSRKFYANRLGVSENKIKELKRQVKGFKKEVSKEVVKKENFLKGTLESIVTVSTEPNSHKELAIVHNVDLEKFTITNYWSKLQPTGKFTSSIFCRRKQKGDYSEEDFVNFLKKYKSNYKSIKPPKPNSEKEIVDLELSISDFHLAKKYVSEKNTNVKKRAEVFTKIAERLIEKTIKIYDIDTIMFPISNDFFHTDNYWNQTTNGTPQDTIAEYDEEYEVGFDLLVNTISYLKERCQNVVVVLVQGNHDKTKSFYLAHGLSVYFAQEGNISFIRDSNPVKGVTLGNTFIGYHHGNCKIEDLPLLFATSPEHSIKFGTSKFREVHTGDKHHYMAKEVKGVRVQQMPSLSGADKWHREKNFINNVRAALVLIYDKEKGKSGEFEERI